MNIVMQLGAVAWFWLVATGASRAAEVEVGGWHLLKDPTGREGVEARLEGKRDGRYLLRRRNDGRLFEVLPDLLTGADRVWLDQSAKKLAAEMEWVNAAAGRPLFSGVPLEVRPAEEIARILGLREESRTRHSRSWRSYHRAGSDYRLFGALPYSLALYADGQGNATALSAVYANKGDFGSQAGAGQDHFQGGTTATTEALAKAIAQDFGVLQAMMGKLGGELKRQRFGEGKGRRDVLRTDWNGHSLLLSREEGEYVSLLVVPVDFAEAKGRTAMTHDGVLRKRLREDIRREANGDVVLTEIPMVDQGPKGYCAPATFERAMRTMGIETDMYLLAMIGGSAIGGGTSTGQLCEEVRSQVINKARRMRDLTWNAIRVKDVKTYIDDGIPIMWTMMATDEYGRIASGNTTARRKVGDWAEYARAVKALGAEYERKPKPAENHHICLIVGYNEATDEIAVSDSWGPAFACRWVPAKVATWVSMEQLYVILL